MSQLFFHLEKNLLQLLFELAQIYVFLIQLYCILRNVEKLNQKPVDMLGHVTSSYFSPNLNKSIALAVMKSGKKLKGKKFFVPMENKNINVTVTDTVFFDKENKRLNA